MQVDESIESRARDNEAVELVRKWSAMLPPRDAASRQLLFEGTVQKLHWKCSADQVCFRK